MPVRLPDRCGPDTVLGFRTAAEQRYTDGVQLAGADRRTAAVYLWGYAVEMMLKAAYFQAFGYDPRRAIATADLRAARELASALPFQWPQGGNLHHLPAWATLLVRTRTQLAHTAYPNPLFPAEVVSRAVRVFEVWRETIRYHQNTAYEFEVRAVREQTEWFLEHAARL